jgi:hypothetical protein
LYLKNDHFQDRLGTNIGITQKRRCVSYRPSYNGYCLARGKITDAVVAKDAWGYRKVPPYAPPPPAPPLTVDYEISVDEQLVYSIATVEHGTGSRTLLDSYDRSIAAPPPPAVESNGGDGVGGCSFKLLLRGSMIELYVNDVLSESSLLPIAGNVLHHYSLPLPCLGRS